MLGEKIKTLRAQKGLSQAELATRLDVVRQTISKWEKELSLPDSDMLVKIAEVFGTTVSELVGEETKSEETQIKKPRRLKTWEIVLLALGSPLWISLLIAALAIILSLYISLWAVIILLWAVFASLMGCSIGGVLACVAFIIGGNGPSCLAVLAAGFVCAGLAIFMFYGCKAVTKHIFVLTKKTAIWTKNRIKARGWA